MSVDVALYRRVIATAYSCGGHVLAPYDVYHENHPRIFGKPEDYADLYGFARAMAGYLDGYEDAAVAGQGFADERFAELPSVEIAADSVYAFVRARPHDASAPVVIHMVDWRSRPEPTTIMLLPVRFLLRIRLSRSCLCRLHTNLMTMLQQKKWGFRRVEIRAKPAAERRR